MNSQVRYSRMPLFYHILSIPAKLLTCLNADTPPAHPASGGDAVSRCPILQTLLEQLFSMLRAAGLLPLLGGIQRFSTSGRPEVPDACCVAHWRLPRLDSYQLALTASAHTMRLLYPYPYHHFTCFSRNLLYSDGNSTSNRSQSADTSR